MATDVLEYDPPETAQVKPIFGYYKQPNGWVTVAVTSPMERLYYLEEGWTYLRQYGLFDMNGGYTADHPLELLFINGGAKELPLDQVIEMGFHVKAPQIPRCRMAITQNHKKHNTRCFPMVDVVFPQLEDVRTEVYPCFDESCRRSQPGQEFPTLAAKKNHEAVMHKEDKSNMGLGKVLAESLLKGMGKQPVSGEGALSVLVDAGLTMAQRKALAEAGFNVGSN